MVRTVTLNTEISAERELRIKLPDDVPLGAAEIVVVIASPDATSEHDGTLGAMVESPLFGLWRDRDDIGDSAEYARALRTQVEQRYRE